jgi:hypothetical protein
MQIVVSRERERSLAWLMEKEQFSCGMGRNGWSFTLILPLFAINVGERSPPPLFLRPRAPSCRVNSDTMSD